jgi:hypothetical protein
MGRGWDGAGGVRGKGEGKEGKGGKELREVACLTTFRSAIVPPLIYVMHFPAVSEQELSRLRL